MWNCSCAGLVVLLRGSSENLKCCVNGCSSVTLIVFVMHFRMRILRTLILNVLRPFCDIFYATDILQFVLFSYFYFRLLISLDLLIIVLLLFQVIGIFRFTYKTKGPLALCSSNWKYAEFSSISWTEVLLSTIVSTSIIWYLWVCYVIFHHNDIIHVACNLWRWVRYPLQIFRTFSIVIQSSVNSFY